MPSGSSETDSCMRLYSKLLKLVSCSKLPCVGAFITLGHKGNTADLLPKANISLYEYLSLLPQRVISLEHCLSVVCFYCLFFKCRLFLVGGFLFRFSCLNAMHETSKHQSAVIFSIQCKYFLPSYGYVSQILIRRKHLQLR